MPDAKERRGGRGAGFAPPEKDADDTATPAEGSESNTGNGSEGEAYEDNWYRSLKAFAASRQAFGGGEEEEDSDEEADADEAEGVTDEAPAEPDEAPGVTASDAPELAPLPPPPPERSTYDEEEHFIKGSAPAIKHVEAVSHGTANELALMWRNFLESPPDGREALATRIQHQGKTADLVRLALDHAGSDSPTERALAVEAAGLIGGDACTEMAMNALDDDEAKVRIEAARALHELHPAAAAEILGKHSADPDPAVRVEIVRALGVIDHPSILGSLFGFLGDADPDVGAMALEVLTEWRSPAVAKRLAAVLASPELRNMASEVLVEMGPASEKLLLEVLMQRHPGATPTVGRLLGRIMGIEGCIERLTAPDPMERLRGVEALGAIGGPRAVESLVGTLSDPDSDIRVRALQLLGKLGDERAASAVERSARTDPVADVVTAAGEALERLAEAQNTKS